jgi:hypothetical protein
LGKVINIVAKSQTTILDLPEKLLNVYLEVETLTPRQNEAILYLTVCLETSFIKKDFK